MRGEANDFWRFSLDTYRVAEVAAACLALQDGCGADVNMLLYCCWLGRSGRTLDEPALRAVMAAVAHWQNEVIKPLRQVRRTLKRTPHGLPAAWAEQLRKGIGTIELDLEYVEQRMLADAAQRLPAAACPEPSRIATAASLARYLALLLAGPPAHPETQHMATILDACFPPDLVPPEPDAPGR